MDGNSNGTSSSKTSSNKGRNEGNRSTNKRFATVDDGEADLIECSGKNCFIKAPWILGRKCLGLGSKNKNKKKRCCHKKKCKMANKDVDDVVTEGKKEEGLDVEQQTSPMDNVHVNVEFEAEKVWHELYQIGHLGFGRVSFSKD
ncbi:hypothetical protein KIW84_011443 [Lathyrus oleraceus]|uniref:Uncharacterized protein n=1 Tax=Pisum sativum TaxID=3888 RepID=A0A9D5BEY6_PEA|nr:hypothetical protein KIW84_011443 [Pisum sativum]